jgi:hypothetical protein
MSTHQFHGIFELLTGRKLYLVRMQAFIFGDFCYQQRNLIQAGEAALILSSIFILAHYR